MNLNETLCLATGLGMIISILVYATWGTNRRTVFYRIKNGQY